MRPGAGAAAAEAAAEAEAATEVAEAEAEAAAVAEVGMRTRANAVETPLYCPPSTRLVKAPALRREVHRLKDLLEVSKRKR